MALLAWASAQAAAQSSEGHDRHYTLGPGTDDQAAPPPVPLEPEWRWQPPEAIEWVQPVAGRDAHDLLVATGGARLELISTKTGQRRLRPPIQARPGVSPAGSIGETAVYCFDRFTVYSLEVSPPVALRWQSGAWRAGLGEGAAPGADPATFQGDPEELSRIVAAHANRRGVLVARSDGRVGLLDRRDGHVRWQHQFASAATLRLHGRDDTAAVIWKSGPQVAAAFLDVSTGRCQPVGLPPETAWPTWSALATGGLVLVHPNHCSVWQAAGAHRSYATPAASRILAASTTLAAAPVETLVFGTTDGRLRALELASGTARWLVPDQPADAGGWAWVDVQGELLIAATAHGATLRCLKSGTRLATLEAGRTARLLAIVAQPGAIWSLHADGAKEDSQLYLTAIPWGGPTAPTVAVEPRCYRLGPAGRFLRAVWGDGRVVVATRFGLRAYALP